MLKYLIGQKISKIINSKLIMKQRHYLHFFFFSKYEIYKTIFLF